MNENYEDEDEIRPGDPDYDLSEAHGYLWEPRRKWPPRWLIVALTILVIVALLLPALIYIMRS
jgi:hypothetical protein